MALRRRGEAGRRVAGRPRVHSAFIQWRDAHRHAWHDARDGGRGKGQDVRRHRLRGDERQRRPLHRKAHGGRPRLRLPLPELPAPERQVADGGPRRVTRRMEQSCVLQQQRYCNN